MHIRRDGVAGGALNLIFHAALLTDSLNSIICFAHLKLNDKIM
jgi:hypothetical protein